MYTHSFIFFTFIPFSSGDWQCILNFTCGISIASLNIISSTIAQLFPIIYWLSVNIFRNLGPIEGSIEAPRLLSIIHLKLRCHGMPRHDHVITSLGRVKSLHCKAPSSATTARKIPIFSQSTIIVCRSLVPKGIPTTFKIDWNIK